MEEMLFKHFIQKLSISFLEETHQTRHKTKNPSFGRNTLDPNPVSLCFIHSNDLQQRNESFRPYSSPLIQHQTHAGIYCGRRYGHATHLRSMQKIISATLGRQCALHESFLSHCLSGLFACECAGCFLAKRCRSAPKAVMRRVVVESISSERSFHWQSIRCRATRKHPHISPEDQLSTVSAILPGIFSNKVWISLTRSSLEIVNAANHAPRYIVELVNGPHQCSEGGLVSALRGVLVINNPFEICHHYVFLLALSLTP